MDDLISKIILFKAKIPFVFWSAMFFYLFLAVILTIPHFRRRFSSFFLPPVPSTGEYVAFLDVIRGLTILWVTSFHAWQWLWPFNEKIGNAFIRQGFKGVAIFAVLSGFLAYRSLAKKELSREHIWSYLRNRFVRIYPMYLFAALYPLAMGYVRGGAGIKTQDVMAEIFLLPVFSYNNFINPVAWFVHAAIIFYILLPLWMTSTRKYRLHSAIVALVVFCLLGDAPRTLHIMRYFLMGVVTAEVAGRTEGLRSRWAALLMALGIALVFTDLYIEKDIISSALMRFSELTGMGLTLVVYPAVYKVNNTSIAIGLGFSLALLGIIRFPGIFNMLSVYPLRFIGLISYSIYMLHSLIIVSDFDIYFNGRGFLNHLRQLPGGIGDYFSLLGLYFPSFIFVATISYTIIERPFQRLFRRIKA